MIDETQLVTAKTAAGMCGVSLRWFLKYLADGRGPGPVEIDGHRFYRADDVRAWDKTRRKRAKGAAGGLP